MKNKIIIGILIFIAVAVIIGSQWNSKEEIKKNETQNISVVPNIPTIEVDNGQQIGSTGLCVAVIGVLPSEDVSFSLCNAGDLTIFPADPRYNSAPKGVELGYTLYKGGQISVNGSVIKFIGLTKEEKAIFEVISNNS